MDLLWKQLRAATFGLRRVTYPSEDIHLTTITSAIEIVEVVGSVLSSLPPCIERQLST